MTTAVAARASTAAVLVAYAATHTPTRMSSLGAMAAYAPRGALYIDTGASAALVVYSTGVPALVPSVSQLAALVVWGTGVGIEARTRAWTFTLDGHAFYVLDLGEEGTFCYDIGTGEWCRFRTSGYVGWNMRIGTMWGEGNRIVGGDTTYDVGWELDPDLTMDEGFRDIMHLMTGGIMTRSRVYIGVEAVRIAGSMGGLGDPATLTMNMRFSDDSGNTWSDNYPVALVSGAFGSEAAWRSMGSFMAPGRVFEFSDASGLVRIDGADVFIEDFDDANSKYMRQYGVYE